MAISKVKNIFSTYTLDDSDETSNYHRVLFRPGVSVQARELTELQTNLQRQIDYHGQYAFVDGSRVTGGELALDVEYDYVKVESEFTNGDGTFTAADFISTIANTIDADGVRTKITNSNGVEAEVLQVISEAGVDLASGSNKSGILESGNTTDPLTLYIKYTKGSGTTDSNLFSSGEVVTANTNTTHKLMIGGGQLTDVNVVNSVSNISNAVGQGSKITINEGVYFANGNFVYTQADEIVLDKYSNSPNNIIGLNVVEKVITAIDDPNLVDNAQGFPNASAPGADRYQIKTQLIKEPLNAPNTIYTNYLTLLRVENGVIQKKVAPAAEIDTELTRRFANRTFEESGNYSLKPFILDMKEHLDNGYNNGYKTAANGGDEDKYVVGIEPNVAYVQGFRTENLATKFLEVSKPREQSTAPMDFVTKQSTTSSLPLGNYIRVKINTISDSIGLPDINTFRELALQDKSLTAAQQPVALVDDVSDGSGNTPFTSSASTGRTPGTYFITDTGSSGTICTSGTEGGRQGSGAKFKIIIDQSKIPTIEVLEGGAGYAIDGSGNGNIFTVKGSHLGGADTTNDLTFEVAQLGVGRARCRAVTQDTDDILRLYLFDIIMTKGQFAQVDKVEQISTITGGGGANYFEADLVSQIGASTGKKYDSENNSYVWKLPYYGIKTAEIGSDPSPIYQIQKRLYVHTATAANEHTFAAALADDETLISTAGVILSIGSGPGTVHATLTDATAVEVGTNGVKILSNDISTGDSLAAIIVVQKDGSTSNKKTKQFNTVTNRSYIFDGSNPLLLDAYDIYALNSVRLGAPDGTTDGNSLSGATEITLTNTTSSTVDVGMGVVHDDIPAGTTVLSKNAHVITLSNAITSDIASGSTIKFIGADITDKFDLDNGQTANYYGEGKIVPLQNIVAGTLYVSFQHYTHSSGDYFVLDSYPEDDSTNGHYLKDTPKFKLPSGEEVDLKSCVDFRPTKATTGVTHNSYGLVASDAAAAGSFNGGSGIFGGGSINSPAVQPASQFIMNAQIWLPRIDKIVLTRDGEYKILEGVSSENPVPREDPADCMVIATLKVKPFCYDARIDIIPDVRNYKRYTMKHIAEIDKRLKKLEYYTSLSLQEQSTFNISLNEVVQKTTNGGDTYEDTVERFKNGIFTDQFKGHGNGHVVHPNYKCSVDKKNNVVRPFYDEQGVNLVRKANDNGAAVHNRSMYTLPYDSVPFIDQPNATETEFINPYNMFVWTGTCRLSPDSDEWKDVKHLPDVIINDDSQYDYLVALYEEQGLIGQYEWGEWETDWSSVETDIQNFSFDRSIDGDTQWRNMGGWMQPGNISGNITTTTTTTGQSQKGTLSYVSENTVTTESGDQVVEVNYIPFIRSREVFFTAELLKPNTKLYAFFNDVNVTAWCAEKAFEEFTDRVNVVEHTGKNQHFAASPGALTTDSSGRITGSFIVPNTEALKFKTGERIFKLTDSPSNDTASLNDESTYAEAIYRAQGMLETKQNTIINTKTAQIAHQEVTQNRVLTERNVSDNTKVQWFDPLAQSILITEKGGCFITELDIFLNTADPSIPINVSIREMQNGYPTQKIVPGSDTVIYPSALSSGTTLKSSIVPGKKYRIMSGGGTGSGQADFRTIGARDNNAGTVFRVPLDTQQSVIDALHNNARVDEVNVLYTGSSGSMISDNASAALPVTFANPVYLSQDQEYAIVLMSNSDIYKLFVTTPGKNDLTTNVLVDGNHYGGSFFMSQNASTWTADPRRDLKFKLYKARFDSSATITFVNDQIPVKELSSDPFLVCGASTDNSAVLRVNHPNHGMMEGSTVLISGATGIQSCSSGLINTTHTISDVERDSYCITIADNAVDPMTENVYGGGSNVTATENMTVDALVPYAEVLNLPETDIVVTFDSFSARSQDGNESIFNPIAGRPLTLNKTNYLDNPIAIASSAEHGATDTVGDLDNRIAANKSFGMNVTLSTSNTNLTPAIDGDRCSLFCISNRTNSAVTATQIGSQRYNNTAKGRYYVPDTAAKGNSNLNAYITKEITLAQEATHLNFYADVFKPVGSDIILYYKAQTSGDDVPFDDLPWTRLDPTVPIPANDTKFGTVDYEVNLADVPEVTNTFSSFAFKVVFVAENSSRPPMVSNIRAIAST